jgi:hypothetical protein
MFKEENHHPKTPKNTHTRKNKLWTDQNKKTDHGYLCTYMVGLLGQFWRKIGIGKL